MMQSRNDIKAAEKKSRLEEEAEAMWHALQRTYHDDIVNCIRISNDGLLAASGSSDYTVKIWDTVTHKCVHTFVGHERPVTSIAFSPDGKCIASGSRDFTVKIWNIAAAKCINTLNIDVPGHFQSIWCLEYSPSGDTLAAGRARGRLSLWNTDDWKIRWKSKEDNSSINAVAFSRDGKYLFSANYEGILRVWNAQTGALIKTIHEHNMGIDSICVSKDGHRLASVSEAYIVISEIDTWDLVRKFPIVKHGSLNCAFSIHDRYIFVSSSVVAAVVVYDTVTGTCIGRTEIPYDFLGVPNRVMQIAFDVHQGDIRAIGVCSQNPPRTIYLGETIEALKLDSVVAAGLASNMPFLTKGLYDPRLLCLIRQWIGVK